MQITRIEPLKGRGKKFRVYLNDEPAFLLYASDLAEYKLSEGQELDPGTLETIYSAVLLKRAELRCMYILKTMDKTEWQIRRKLKEEEYPDRVIDGAVEYVKSYRYIDDLRYSRNYMESRQQSRSRQQITAELRNRGVRPEIIEQAFEESGAGSEASAIRYWMEKKHIDPDDCSEEEIKKFIVFLQRKGFHYQDIKKTLTHVL